MSTKTVMRMEQKVETAIGGIAEILIVGDSGLPWLPWDDIFGKVGKKKPFERVQRNGQWKDVESFKDYLCYFLVNDKKTFVALIEDVANRNDRKINFEKIRKMDSYLSVLNYRIDIDSAGVKRVVVKDEFGWLQPWPEVHDACLAAREALLQKPVDWDKTCIEKTRDAFERLLKHESGSPTKSIAGSGGQIDDFVGIMVQHSGIDDKQVATVSAYMKSIYGLLSTHGTHSPATVSHWYDAEHFYEMGISLLKWMLREIKRIP